MINTLLKLLCFSRLYIYLTRMNNNFNTKHYGSGSVLVIGGKLVVYEVII